MLERLEISIINSSVCENIVDFRIDADTYKKKYLREEAILKGLKSKPIEKVITSIQNFGAYSLCNEINFVEDGIPFLMTQNVRDNYISWDNIRYVDKRSHEMLHKSHCKKGQVLITMAGEYLGKAAVYDKDFISSSNQAVAKLTLKDDYSPYYVSTFINCKYGQNQISRFRTRTGQPNINMGLIKSLLIPYMNKDFSIKIEHLVLEAQKILLQANKKYEDATNLVEKELELDKLKIEDENMTVKSFSESFQSTGRLDAEYYQLKYDAYEKHIKEYINGYTTPKDCFNLVETKCPKVLKEYPYVEIGDIDIGTGNAVFNMVETENLPANAKIMTRKGDLLVSTVRPYRGAVAVLNEDNLLVSGAFTVLRKKSTYPAQTLQVLLRIKMYKDWLLKFNVGTSYPVIKDDDVLNIPIPNFDDDVHLKIEKYVNESQTTRNRSLELLSIAKKAVEIAIENSEEEALKWLSDRI